MAEKIRCLWLADDGRCASCKSKRIRMDVMKLPDYEICHPEIDYGRCEFYKEKPVPKK